MFARLGKPDGLRLFFGAGKTQAVLVKKHTARVARFGAERTFGPVVGPFIFFPGLTFYADLHFGRADVILQFDDAFLAEGFGLQHIAHFAGNTQTAQAQIMHFSRQFQTAHRAEIILVLRFGKMLYLFPGSVILRRFQHDFPVPAARGAKAPVPARFNNFGRVFIPQRAAFIRAFHAVAQGKQGPRLPGPEQRGVSLQIILGFPLADDFSGVAAAAHALRHDQYRRRDNALAVMDSQLGAVVIAACGLRGFYAYYAPLIIGHAARGGIFIVKRQHHFAHIKAVPAGVIKPFPLPKRLNKIIGIAYGQKGQHGFDALGHDGAAFGYQTHLFALVGIGHHKRPVLYRHVLQTEIPVIRAGQLFGIIVRMHQKQRLVILHIT